MFDQAGLVLGTEGLGQLLASGPSSFEAAKATFALARQHSVVSDPPRCMVLLKKAHSFLEESGRLSTLAGQQLEIDLVTRMDWLYNQVPPTQAERAWVVAIQAKAKGNEALARDPVAVWFEKSEPCTISLGCAGFAWNDGRCISDETLHDALVMIRDVMQPLYRQARDLCTPKGARWVSGVYSADFRVLHRL